jgi:hypothetical protein
MPKQVERVFYSLDRYIFKRESLQSFLYTNINTTLGIKSNMMLFRRINLLKKRVSLFLYIQCTKRSTRISLINQ